MTKSSLARKKRKMQGIKDFISTGIPSPLGVDIQNSQDLLLSDGRMVRHVKDPIRQSTYPGQKECSVLYKGFDRMECIHFDAELKKFLERFGFKAWSEGYNMKDNERELMFRVEE
jgi:hypothetical protein